MRDLDLEPHQYADVDRRTGKVKRRLSKRFARNYGLVCLAVLAFIFITRDQGSTATLFGVTALFSLVAGGMIGHWLRDLY